VAGAGAAAVLWLRRSGDLFGCAFTLQGENENQSRQTQSAIIRIPNSSKFKFA
jgi:hypothetical protein